MLIGPCEGILLKETPNQSKTVGMSSEHTVNFYKPLSLMEPKNCFMVKY